MILLMEKEKTTYLHCQNCQFLPHIEMIKFLIASYKKKKEQKILLRSSSPQYPLSCVYLYLQIIFALVLKPDFALDGPCIKYVRNRWKIKVLNCILIIPLRGIKGRKLMETSWEWTQCQKDMNQCLCKQGPCWINIVINLCLFCWFFFFYMIPSKQNQ